MENKVQVHDLFQILDRMGFTTEEYSLNNTPAYQVLKKYLSNQMNDQIPPQYLDEYKLIRRAANSDVDPHFQKRDLNEAEEY